MTGPTRARDCSGSINVVLLAAVLAAPSGAGAFELKHDVAGHAIHWHEMPVRYAMSAPGARQIDLAQAESAVHEAFAAWSGAEGADLRFAWDGRLDLEPGYVRGEVNHNGVFWMRDAWHHDPSALAITVTFFESDSGRLVDGDILINERDHRWGVGEEDSNDLQNTLAHEVGHFLGLGHSEHREATMYASAMGGETHKRTLHHDDEAGAARLYPDAEVDPVAPRPEPLSQAGAFRDDAVDAPAGDGDEEAPIGGPPELPLGCSASGAPAPGLMFWLLLAVMVPTRRSLRDRPKR